MPWAMVAAAAAVVCALAGWVLTHPRSTPASSPEALPTVPKGKPAPAFDLPRLGGGPSVELSKGRPAVINFFASWCPNCSAELSAFASESSRTRGSVSFIGIDSNDSDPGSAERLLHGAGATYPVGVDRSASTATAYLVVGLPTTIFVDREGQVVGEAFGAQSVRSLQAWLARLSKA
jgi:thiol-disulfide isomerase/thioredoxin